MEEGNLLNVYHVSRPNTGLLCKLETLGDLEKKYKKVTTEEAESHWTQQYESSLNTCSHAYWRGNCQKKIIGQECENGLRRRTYNVLSGSVLSIWSQVENILAMRSGHSSKLQVVRLKIGTLEKSLSVGVLIGIIWSLLNVFFMFVDEKHKIVGTIIPKPCMEALKETLSSDAQKTEEQTF